MSWSPARKAVRKVLRTCTGTFCSVRTHLRSVAARSMASSDCRPARKAASAEITRRWDAVLWGGPG